MIRIIRSKRKTVSVEITRSADIVVRAPIPMSDAEIRAFLDSKNEWIEKHVALVKSKKNAAAPCFSSDELRALAKNLKPALLRSVAHYAKIIGVNYGRITIRAQRTRWGSCSQKGNLNFNCLLSLAPSDVLDYVVIHELCHLRHMDHSKKFWADVEKYCPEYKSAKAWLKADGSALIDRIK